MFSPTFFNPSSTLSVIGSPTSYDVGVATSLGNTAAFTMTPSGGVAPYTYSWTIDAIGGDGLLTVTSPSAASTVLHYSDLAYNGSSVSGTLTGVVTDGLGATAFVNISTSVTRTSGGGIPP